MTTALSHLSPDDLARRVGRSGRQIRQLLRQLYPNEAPGSGGRWTLRDDQVEFVLAYFSGSSGAATASASPAAIGALARTAFDSTGAPIEWYWEGNVQAAVVEFLASTGWSISRVANTASRARGPDIEAHRGSTVLVVEVKGYPSTGYRDPRRANEVKRTSPTLQAKHWYAEALLKAVRVVGTQPERRVAIALPDFPRYRTLVAETSTPLIALGITILFVSSDGSVDEVGATIDPGIKADGH